MRGVSLGLGLTNACDRSCAHCYRPRGGPSFLSHGDVVRALEALEVASVNLGTGENLLNPDLQGVLDELDRRRLPASLTSNGMSLLGLDEHRLRRLHDVEVSFDFATEAEMDAFRGPEAWRTAVAAVERCVRLGLKVTVLAVLMRINHDRLGDIARMAGRLGARFRVNVFQPVHPSELQPTWEQLWEAFRRLFAETELLTCTEPVVRAALGGPASERRRGCGHTSVRITPTGEALPCVYWPRPAGGLRDLERLGQAALFAHPEFSACRATPRGCLDCPDLEVCGGGCASRRMLTGDPDAPDPYCPRRSGQPVALRATLGPGETLLHAANVCTTIVRAAP